MFCKYCGKAIDEGTMRCRICGRPVGPLEGGTGFWDLREEPKGVEAPREEETVIPPLQESAPAEESAPAPAQDPAPSVPTVPAPSPADNKAIRELRSQVKKLQEEMKIVAPQKRGGVAGGAVLLALLALALGVFILFQVRTLSGKVQSLEMELARNVAMTESAGAEGQGAAGYGEQAPLEEGVSGESKWQGFDELSGLHLYSKQELFEGPNKGENDLRGQSIKMGLPDNGYEETPIFTSRFIGPAGTYRYYWVKVETNEDTLETYFTPLKEEDGYLFRIPNASDTNKTFILSIVGEVKQEHLGYYAFVAEDTQTRSAYVSGIVELYDRAEKNVPGTWDGSQGSFGTPGNQGQGNGDDHGN